MNEAIDRFGADAFRYYLLREVPFDTDGSFSWERFEQVYTAELANTWGNLASRVIAMIEKYFGGSVPGAQGSPLDDADAGDIAAYHAAMDGARGFLLHEGLRRVMACVTRGNEFVQSSQPWTLAKTSDGRDELASVMAALTRALARQCVLLFPFVPAKAQALWEQLGGPGRVEDQRMEKLTALDATGWRVRRSDPLFPKPTASS
jgi:methionyl-tRNA synthetase